MALKNDAKTRKNHLIKRYQLKRCKSFELICGIMFIFAVDI